MIVDHDFYDMRNMIQHMEELSLTDPAMEKCEVLKITKIAEED
jgi:hypothetical protein